MGNSRIRVPGNLNNSLHEAVYLTYHKSFLFGSCIILTKNTLDKLVTILQSSNFNCSRPLNMGNNKIKSKMKTKASFTVENRDKAENSNKAKQKSILGGRGKIQSTCIPEAGQIVIKNYQRGGLIRYFNKNIHIRPGKTTRPETEFNMLITAGKAGINVPSPLIYVIRGSLLYKAWLITKKIHHCENFADIALKSPEKAVEIFPDISGCINRLIKNRIYHVDLHPGNILIDPDNKHYIIDFDKAFIFKHSMEKLTKLYEKRWKRAVIKYHLPEFISDLNLIHS